MSQGIEQRGPLSSPLSHGQAVRPPLDVLLASSSWDQLVTSTERVGHAQVASVRDALWKKYQSYFRCTADQEVCSKKKLCEKMRIEYTVIGEKPPEGYPLYVCLHGGGGTTSFVNDSQWEHMQVYYRESVATGVYVAPRGITNTWNLHFVKESYELYDRLIAYMILCHGVDPNRVYLLGFSAGGDGVYQVTPRMADRWAAANMSSGHPNGVRMVNLYHVPFAIQVGERDTAYNRSRVGAEYGVRLDKLRQLHPDGYVHECWVHLDKGHNTYKDNDKKQCTYRVVGDLGAWLKNGDDRSKSVKRNTNAIAWVSQHQRDPVPSHLIWDVGTRAHRSPLYAIEGVTAPSDLFYWIDIGGHHQSGSCDATRIEASFDRDSNAIHITEGGCGSWIRILISDRMLNTRCAVKVTVGDQEFVVQLNPSLATMARTLLERGDPNFMFESEVILSKVDTESGQWEISGTIHV